MTRDTSMIMSVATNADHKAVTVICLERHWNDTTHSMFDERFNAVRLDQLVGMYVEDSPVIILRNGRVITVPEGRCHDKDEALRAYSYLWQGSAIGDNFRHFHKSFTTSHLRFQHMPASRYRLDDIAIEAARAGMHPLDLAGQLCDDFHFAGLGCPSGMVVEALKHDDFQTFLGEAGRLKSKPYDTVRIFDRRLKLAAGQDEESKYWCPLMNNKSRSPGSAVSLEVVEASAHCLGFSPAVFLFLVADYKVNKRLPSSWDGIEERIHMLKEGMIVL